ncbi:MAG: hypothetical protein OIF57_17510 [Marinobacterium sp.]|nr:hypothetical protein [Marinobacterium sp.]
MTNTQKEALIAQLTKSIHAELTRMGPEAQKLSWFCTREEAEAAATAAKQAA